MILWAALTASRKRPSLRTSVATGFSFIVALVLAAHFNGIAGGLATRFGASFLVAGSAPDTAVFFGPRQFVTTKSNKDENFVESFSVPIQPGPISDTAGNPLWQVNRNAYTVRLRRVGGSLTTATVKFGGTQIATVADFVSTTYIERPIYIFDGDFNSTQVAVTLKGAIGAGLNMELTRFRGRLTRPNFGVEVVHESQQEGRISGTARAA